MNCRRCGALIGHAWTATIGAEMMRYAKQQGFSDKQIAQAHRVSLNTVKFHTRNLFGKLGVRNRSQAVALYLKS